MRQLLDLDRGADHVDRVGVGHRLHAHRRIAADRDDARAPAHAAPGASGAAPAAPARRSRRAGDRSSRHACRSLEFEAGHVVARDGARSTGWPRNDDLRAPRRCRSSPATASAPSRPTRLAGLQQCARSAAGRAPSMHLDPRLGAGAQLQHAGRRRSGRRRRPARPARRRRPRRGSGRRRRRRRRCAAQAAAGADAGRPARGAAGAGAGAAAGGRRRGRRRRRRRPRAASSHQPGGQQVHRSAPTSSSAGHPDHRA